MASNATNIKTIFRFKSVHTQKDYDMCWCQTDIMDLNHLFRELDLKYFF
jgi:hypothetical protein